MKKLNRILFIGAIFLSGLTFYSCTGDLDTEPIDESILLSEAAWKKEATYDQVLAKVYAGLTLSGNKGPSDEGDLTNGDQGVATFTRGLWNLQEMPTDEAICAWDNDGLRPLQFNQWGPENNYVYQFFQRVMLNVAFCNEYLRETTDDKLSSRGMTSIQEKVHVYRDEIRALRALNYYYMMDLYGNVPFITENDGVGAGIYPVSKSRAEMFPWLESELKEIEANGILAEKDYSRVSLSTVRTVLAKLYLNAQVYIGTSKYTEAAEYCKKVINSYGELNSSYKNLFRADNHLYTNEIIFGLPYDSNYATSYGGTTFLIAAAISGTMSPALNFGLNASWEGNRARPELTRKFDQVNDKRFLFWTADRTEEVSEWNAFTQGYSITKFSNLKSDEDVSPNPDSAPTFADSDWPLFRLADVYLMYAEALVRSNSTSSDITTYFNKVRTRAGVSSMSLSQITLDEILDERLRELYWEGQRRTDLIRFGKFLSGYNWTYKGGSLGGNDINSKYLIFPIPTVELASNPELTQNPGY